jgi:hypothetical protein
MKALPILVTLVALTYSNRGHGNVVYSPFTYDRPGNGNSLDVNQDGTVDFTLSRVWMTSHDSPSSGMSYSFGIHSTTDSYVLGESFVLGVGTKAAVLSADTEISLFPPEPDGWQQTQYGSLLVGRWSSSPSKGWSGWEGPMDNVQEGFLGLQFLASDGPHFGWLRVRKAGDRLPSIVPVDFAWETQAGVPISAGVVPEPSVVTLTILGLSSLAVFTRIRASI